jgi:YggT family protein
MTVLLFTTLDYLLEIISWAVIIRALLSWIPNLANTKFASILYNFTEPILAPVRALISKIMKDRYSMIDFSTIAVILVAMIIQVIISPYVRH